MGKEDVAHIMEYYSAIKREKKCANCRHMDGPRDHHSGWNVRKRKQTSHINTYMWHVYWFWEWKNI